MMETIMQIVKIDLLNDLLKGSVTESLIGILSGSDISIEEMRDERITKHERII